MYPCIKPSEMSEMERILEEIYKAARTNNTVSCLLELEGIPRERTVVQLMASEIRTKEIEMDRASGTSNWKIILGFHPKLVKDIVIWYREAEQLRQRIIYILDNRRTGD
ncbi:hypothetical protein Moror_12285 [Moniliophthora roreri MCA 2997]|uniref:Uncharacterized protein n=1 Tax=Moniliophthora roreri (strain MCA 2997) TaxID=1381753 RepID=V2W7L4_MONRO|nr:hypothetical protein Moror_12285 [Moniliophthora roreri MCA 2997]